MKRHTTLLFTLVLVLLGPLVGWGSDPALMVTIGEVGDSTAVVWARASGGQVIVEYGIGLDRRGEVKR